LKKRKVIKVDEQFPAFGGEPRPMLRIINVSTSTAIAIFRVNMVGRFCKPHTGQAVGGELGLMVLIGGAEERSAIHSQMSTWLRRKVMKNFFRDTWWGEEVTKEGRQLCSNILSKSSEY
jgi:hypothetical protein